MEELRQTSEYAKYMNLIGWQVDKIDGIYCYTKKIPIIGSVIKIQRASKVISKEGLNKLAKNNRPFLVSVEPLTNSQLAYYSKLGFKSSHSASLPTKTIRVDLSESGKHLLSHMHYKTRYNIKIAAKRGVVIITSKDILSYSDFWQKCAKNRGMYLPLKKEIQSIYKAFGNKSEILLASIGKEIVGGVLLVSTVKIAYYMYAASTAFGKKVFAPTALAWEAIEFAKRRKKTYFDFEGIYDARVPINTWKGFTRFKKSFGGVEMDFPLQMKKYSVPF